MGCVLYTGVTSFVDKATSFAADTRADGVLSVLPAVDGTSALDSSSFCDSDERRVRDGCQQSELKRSAIGSICLTISSDARSLTR